MYYFSCFAGMIQEMKHGWSRLYMFTDGGAAKLKLMSCSRGEALTSNNMAFCHCQDVIDIN